MQKLNSRFIILLLWLLYFGTTENSVAQLQDEIIKSFEKIYPHKTAVFDSLETGRLETISETLIHDSYEISSLKRETERLRLNMDLQSSYNIPYFFLSAGITGYESYDRIVNVIANVPVKWDNKNPIKTDYRLPNGGRGIMWIPQPMEWADRGLDLHASTAYKDFLQTYTAGLNYRFPFGLTISALNLSFHNRLLPKTYGYPYSTTVTNSFELPLFKNFGKSGSNTEFEKSIAQIGIDITGQNIKNVSGDISYNTIQQFFKTYVNWNVLQSINKLISLTEAQLQDYRILVDKNLISVYDRLRIEREYARLKAQKESAIFEFIFSTTKLNPVKVTYSHDVNLFIPMIDSLENAADNLEYLLLKNYFSDKEGDLFRVNNDIIMADKFLQQAKINLRYSENQSEPDISITGGITAFQSDELGYNNVAKSLGDLFTKSDGIAWNVGLTYRFSFSSSPDKLNYLVSVKDYQDKLEKLKETNEYIKQSIDDQIIKLKAAHIVLENSRRNLEYSKNVLKEGDELFSLKRISRFDHSEYQKNVINEEMNTLSAFDNYLTLLLQLSKTSGFEPKTILRILEKGKELSYRGIK